jgi:hypothetical protein
MPKVTPGKRFCTGGDKKIADPTGHYKVTSGAIYRSPVTTMRQCSCDWLQSGGDHSSDWASLAN